MKVTRSVQLGAVNIALHPHTTSHYVQFWTALFDLGRVIKLRGDSCLLIGSITPFDKKDPTLGFHGSLYRFTDIDFSKPWLDLTTGIEAKSDVVKKEVIIPSHLRPNLTAFEYAFFPEEHRLIFESASKPGTLSPRTVEYFISHLAASESISAVFPECEVTMEQDVLTIARLLKWKEIKLLSITVKRPNPDGHGKKEDEAVFDELEEEGAKTKTVILKSTAEGTIKPNEDTQRLARVAGSNGRVDALIIEGGNKIPVSSRSVPRVHASRWNHKQMTLIDHVLAEAKKFAKELVDEAKDHAKPKNGGDDGTVV